MAEKTEKIETAARADAKAAPKTEAKAAPAAAANSAAKFDLNSLNTLAVVSLATAVTGFGAVAAIITGHISLAQIKKSGQSGRGLAIAGVIVGYAVVALWVLGGIASIAYKLRYGFGYGDVMPMDGFGTRMDGFGNGMMGQID